jgi:glycosyltransferase involved in cell wall biosynthesis
MNASIDLLWIGDSTTAPDWQAGRCFVLKPTVQAIHTFLEDYVRSSRSEYCLFWSDEIEPPNSLTIERVASQPGNVWHAGLKLGMSGLPPVLDYVTPTWMLNCDPNANTTATSWRLSLRACLVNVDVLRQLGGIKGNFRTLDAAALEMGHRFICSGVIIRYVPWMVETSLPPQKLPFEDEVRFLLYRARKVWQYWALARAFLGRYAPPVQIARALVQVSTTTYATSLTPFRHNSAVEAPKVNPSVTILIPTVDRYPYLRTLLGQLRLQTVKPLEIIVVDQTAPEKRDTRLAADFADLPLTVLYMDRAGQCSSRNAGLRRAKGDFVLFVDDDDEVSPDLIECHIGTIAAFSNDVSSGSVNEVGAGPLHETFSFTRVSDVFPTNNTLMRKAVLHDSGLFDLAYERMARADGDLGMRIYLTGALMVYNSDISVLHHHAPKGGLRKHKARVVTYASSRRSLTHRDLPSPSEIYLNMRYFTPKQVNEALWHSFFGTFAVRGNLGRKLLKGIVSTILLPQTAWRLWRNYREAQIMLGQFPQIPTLASQDHS